AHRLVWNGFAYAAAGINLTDGDYISVAVASNISLGSGSFNTGGNWASGSVPNSGAPAVVAAGHSLTLGSNTTAGSLLVSIGSTLSLGSYNLTLNAGDMFNSGTLNAGTGIIQFSAGVNQQVTSNGATLYNVTMSGSGGTTLRDDLDVSNV